jgi:hypothetical protein
LVKSRTCPDFAFEKAGNNKIQSIFQKMGLKSGTFSKKGDCPAQKCADGQPVKISRKIV